MRWLVAIGIVIVAAAPRARAGLPSPGPLTRAHAALEGESNCGRCHTSGRYLSAKLCLSCHKVLAGEMARGQGLHGRQYRGKACEKCHTEHLGRGARIVKWPGGAMSKLNHALTGYALQGGHRGVACVKCHTARSRQGTRVFVGTSTACAACHKDPHAGRFGRQCATCHNVTDWNQFDRQRFNHNRTRYPLTGKHQTVACAKCHGTPAKWRPLAFGTCSACHKDPHHGQFKPTPCKSCHNTSGWRASDRAIRRKHPGLSLAAGHARVACRTCHDRGNDKPPSKGSTCVSCHANVHVAKLGNRCERCHASIRWVGLPRSIGLATHRKTRYPLRGKHRDVACGSCHPKSRPLRLRYRKIRFNKCTACHRDVHKGEFASRNRGECSQCHTVAGFSPTTFGVQQHASTGYTLDGEHAATPCGGCHPGARPRLNWKITQTKCADCHANPHGTQFATQMQTGGCAHCHTPYSWNQAKIDHSTFPLTGAHARTPCAACHGVQKKGAPPAAFRGIPRICSGCHEDKHAGQFRQTAPVKQCNACHSTTVWQIPHFDHSKTRYPLDGAHKKLACGKCHTKTTLRNGMQVVRWRLGYIQCKDCHANPHRRPQQ